jgi:outer membrane protein TolC
MNMRAVIRFVLALLPLWAAPCFAQADAVPVSASADAAPASPTELDVFKLWLRTSREITGLRAQVGEARFDVVTATLWPNPQLSLTGNFVAAGRYNPPGPLYNWGPQLNVPLPVFGQISARKREALAALAVAEVNMAAALWSRAADLEQTLVERAFADAEVAEIERNQR